MKRSLTISLAMLLACSSASFAGANFNVDDEQETARRARVVTFPGFLGVELDEVSRDAAQRLNLREERGALINRIVAESNAAKAGLQKDDVIIKWNGERIESALELSRHLRETPAGRTVRLGVIRSGREMDLDVTLGERSEYIKRYQVEREKERAEREVERQKERAERDTERQKERAERDVERQKQRVEREREQQQRQRELAQRMTERWSVARVGDHGRLGIQLQSMSPQLAEYFGLSNRNGALVVFVYSDSPAAKAGIKAGDVILAVGGDKVEGPGDLRRTLASKSEGPVEVRVMRDRAERTFKVQLEKAGATTWMMDADFINDFEVVIPDIIVPMPKLAFAMPRKAFAPSHVWSPKIAPLVMPKMVMPKMVMPKMVTPKMITPKMVMPPMKMAFPKMSFPKITFPKITIPPIRVPITLRTYPKVV